MLSLSRLVFLFFFLRWQIPNLIIDLLVSFFFFFFSFRLKPENLYFASHGGL